VSDRDDDEWLEGLRGESGPAAGDPSHVEGAFLRGAVKRHQAQIAGSSPSDFGANLARENALIARAIEEGLISPRQSARKQRPRYWRPALAAAAAGVLAIGGLWLTQTGRVSAPIVRGSEPVRLTAPNAVELKQRILAELRAAGADAVGYEALGAQGIDADLPLPVTSEIRRVLDAHLIPVPVDGVLRVEIREQP
jgi:hypothetical protein